MVSIGHQYMTLYGIYTLIRVYRPSRKELSVLRLSLAATKQMSNGMAIKLKLITFDLDCREYQKEVATGSPERSTAKGGC